ncbi:uncharacterized protein Z519_11056 [Cladophialophora bantiana CBS 173.52]|uniref:Uncharacterized protein n=1 Tax=Cladophialophora bantiana (strain ATCC 10958 / CBS 173.52 / CDC B-1940 / NIH 8579) TaxID=1442370 RepID=A0A0D2FPB9_CLAB1|nr:uncharacterized protein Z519_11056 [Cladophialophora bantiana CBS 173.52]KIW88487.1 hypothetical protein Z519_11056 [Cladophialophora bantiana CBS 173.52]
MADPRQTAHDMFQFALASGSARDSADMVRARNPGDVVDYDGDEGNEAWRLWDRPAPTSSPKGNLTSSEDSQVSDEDDYDGEVAWAQHQLYFSQQARLIGFNNGESGNNDGVPMFSDDCFAVDGGADVVVGVREDDEEGEDASQVTPWRGPLPPPRRRYRKSVIPARQSLLILALQNSRKQSEKMHLKHKNDKHPKATKLKLQTLLENRVLGPHRATSMGLALQKGEDNRVYSSSDRDHVMKDTYDYRVLAIAQARRERSKIEEPLSKMGEGVYEL